ncbi:dermatopontin-like [Gigantopelta aegis]|uniref:dermatopontin-like n=1 Tax=Gigantopelta aegis TaxID=1735272 RepID=UPI001B888669|nr:dermatopontin-like [Gigantopelta aegis]
MKFQVCLSVFLCVTGVAFSWENNWDGPFEFMCPHGQSIRRITSNHNNRAEDRQWRFECSNTGAVASCVWSGYVNDFDQPLLFQCPNNGVITGISSYHNNNAEDRRFKFHCCSISGRSLTNCRFSLSYSNTFDGYLNFYVPNNQVLKGAFSYHSNGAEDRRWKFEVCQSS